MGSHPAGIRLNERGGAGNVREFRSTDRPDRDE